MNTKLKCGKCGTPPTKFEINVGGVGTGSMCRTNTKCEGFYILDTPMIVKRIDSSHSLEMIGIRMVSDDPQLDYEVHNFTGRDGSNVQVLEVFNAWSGRNFTVLWHVFYDPAKRTEMIYG